MELETVIGLEIHAQLSTKSKLWCGCDNDAFGAEPNSRICPVCTGFPGMLPVLNRDALQKSVRGAAALGCEIQEFSKFDRKNYFYPDLPLGYQISQYDQPLALRGEIKILVPAERDAHGNVGKFQQKKIRITRVHLENDAGKNTHTKTSTLVDFNRSGAPLIEIVTEPELRSPIEARALAQEIQKILRATKVSAADMEKGMMRFDASISLRKMGDKKLFPRSEIKNLNSFAALENALNFEIKRQTKLWEKNEIPDCDSTRGWDDERGETLFLRKKESQDDYRYFPEPDLPPIEFSKKEIEEISETLPELPIEKFFRYKNVFKISELDALKLSDSPELAAFFEKVVEISDDPKKSANLILSVILSHENWQNSKITPEHAADVVQFLKNGAVSSSGGKQLLESAMESGGKIENLIAELGLEQVSDSDEIENWIAQVLKKNPETVAQFQSGKEKVLGFLVGQVMKLSRGSANPEVLQQMLLEKLKIKN
ncbi:Asp-tRNA(Asn)/Glu-tRNA(Gln) amidotransferase subunit GatB [bacterium]|jgi:aspartyl-tRNA(Asn)/glutamyl-tRNA(Gln) amidotransferase subunit B|nr:Asp-tRNA(Asn)/Glu-tRNA(Gln) amidotransferase subunit GatB [bacterium]MBT6832180.1 Asp-tRNA(Asn)/Glu-tRNA(Gln) amidotransferase subunit GatB [bacterium]MBT6996125.1 Asp-tRNA(Asn)/Glu-tRNA(Gln) amidotransferase subunit GatB [bacterium]MBT7772205.1 Asp-tRNA(Asn)/Glu-tRNA(Gln) amidotransferase subunit GatB [bacterium]